MARKRKVDITDAAPIEDVIFSEMDAAIEASVETADAVADSVDAAEETAAPEEPVAEEPEKTAEAEVVESSPTKKKESPKSGIKLGEMKMFSARVYASSVAKQVYFLAVGRVFVIDTEEHDGRVRVALDELNSKVGWADVSELTR